MATRSAVSRYCGNSGSLLSLRFGLLVAVVAFVPRALFAQLTTGAIEGTLRSANGYPAVDSPILITGGAGFRIVIHSNSNGEFTMTLPYGQYRLSGGIQHGAGSSGATVFVAPLQTKRSDLVIDESGSIRGVQPSARTPGIWIDATSGRLFPEAFSLPGLLLSREPSSVTEPLDFTGLSDNRLAIESQRGFSWSDAQYKFQGMDATDSYQPGLPAVLPDVQALEEVVVRSAFARQLLVTGLPQGPFIVATTVRGSPEGGNRAQYVINWNIRLSRQFGLPVGRFTASADLLNVTDAGHRLQENDLSGPSFNLRLPVAIQPPRFVRIGFRYEF